MRLNSLKDLHTLGCLEYQHIHITTTKAGEIKQTCTNQFQNRTPQEAFTFVTFGEVSLVRTTINGKAQQDVEKIDFGVTCHA